MTALDDDQTDAAAAAGHSWIAALLQYRRDGDTFVAPQVSTGPEHRLFGGLVAAQALGAAGATVEPDKLPQSLHAYFVRGGRYGVDVELHVERTRDGRSFDTRRVTAVQQGTAILEMIASFHRPEAGSDWHPPRTPGIAFADAVPKSPDLESVEHFEIRTHPGDDSPFAVPPFWIRTVEHIEDDPLVRACALTYMSDFGPVPSARRACGPRCRHGGEPRPLGVVPPAVRPAPLAPLRGGRRQQQRRPGAGRRLAVRHVRRPGGQHHPGSALALLKSARQVFAHVVTG
jgi:acyl-CoA thioesterase